MRAATSTLKTASRFRFAWCRPIRGRREGIYSHPARGTVATQQHHLPIQFPGVFDSLGRNHHGKQFKDITSTNTERMKKLKDA